MIKYRDYFREYRKLKREILNSVNRVFESYYWNVALIKYVY